jgi:acetyl-CoA C-acetyltransferase
MMGRKVAVVAVAQMGHEEIYNLNIREITYRVVKNLLAQAGIPRDEIGTIITSSSDYWQGICCSNTYYYDAVGGYLKNSSKTEEDGAFAFLYGYLRVMSGHFDTAIVHAITKMSEVPEPSALTNMYADPFSQRPIGIDDLSAAALQANLYMAKYGITEEQAAKVVVKNLGNARSNPYAFKKEKVTVQEVLKSERLAYPIKALDCAPESDATCAILLASEEKARQLTEVPVWIRGVGWSVDDSFLGDRNLLNGGLKRAAQKAYAMAGISRPLEEMNVAEVCEPYSYQELLWCEQLGFCHEGEGGKFIDKGMTSLDGKFPVNPSGGVLAANPYVARGLIRIAEATLQVMGKAEGRQVPGVKTALAHSTHGLAGQHHSVVILGK